MEMMLHSEPENIRLIERPEVQSAFEWQRATAVRCARPGMMFSWELGNFIGFDLILLVVL